MAAHSAAHSDERRRALGRTIAEHRSEIEARWLARVRSDLLGRAEVHPTQLRDGIPDYLDALADLFSDAAPSQHSGTAKWERVARDHGIMRVHVGFDIAQLVREFVILHQTIRSVAEEHGVLPAEPSASLADMIDAAIASSVRAYVETRDYETRRVQAQNIGFLIHELRNPLGAAQLAFDQVRAHAASEQSRACELVDRNLRKVTELIDSVLLTERLEAGRVEPQLADVSVRELIEAATTVARKVAAEKNLAFERRDIPDGKVRADPQLTQSAIQNLVDNAVKYTDTGRVELAVEDGTTSWSVHVRDTCPGLSPEELRTIFEPFRRGRTSKQGTGLGLAITRRAIEAQGGSIHAESSATGGCHFWFELPKR